MSQGQIKNPCGECGADTKLNVYHNQGKLMYEIACKDGCYSSGFKDSFKDALEKWDKIYEHIKKTREQAAEKKEA